MPTPPTTPRQRNLQKQRLLRAGVNLSRQDAARQDMTALAIKKRLKKTASFGAGRASGPHGRSRLLKASS